MLCMYSDFHPIFLKIPNSIWFEVGLRMIFFIKNIGIAIMTHSGKQDK